MNKKQHWCVYINRPNILYAFIFEVCCLIIKFGVIYLTETAARKPSNFELYLELGVCKFYEPQVIARRCDVRSLDS